MADAFEPKLSRRGALALAAGTVAVAAGPALSAESLAGGLKAPFTLPALPYADDALAPVIDAETIGLHHGKHHAGYVKTLNEAVAARPDLQGASLEAMLGRVSQLPAPIRNAGGQHYAHSLYWEVMAPPGKVGAPSAALMAAVTRDFGGLDAMKTAFEKAGTTRFGSGWAWLVATPGGKLAVTSTPNGDVPLMDLAEVKGLPLLANDVWEHAYYLTYRNRRADYLGKWWEVVNWARVSELHAAAIA